MDNQVGSYCMKSCSVLAMRFPRGCRATGAREGSLQRGPGSDPSQSMKSAQK